jgi:hypothetical protein
MSTRGSHAGHHLAAQPRRVVVTGALFGFGDTEEEPDGPQWDLDSEFADDVELVPAEKGTERVRRVAADEGLEVEHEARREHSREQCTVGVVDRWVLEQENSGRDVHARADDLQRRASPGAVGLPVDRGRSDVVPPAERPEVELVVRYSGASSRSRAHVGYGSLSMATS